MHKIVLQSFGGPEALALVETAAPQPARGEVLVELEGAGVNYIDIYQRNGMSRLKPPFTLGLEGVGMVISTGPGTSGALKAGDRVAWVDVAGSYASQIVLPEARCVIVPDDLPVEKALLFQALTAQYLTHEYRLIAPGDRVLVHAAAGGVGQLLVQWLKHLGAWVVGTTSSETKAMVVRDLGADSVIVYGPTYEFREQVMALTQGRGVDLAFDSIGAATFEASINSLARGGTVVSMGAASGPAPAIPPFQLIERCLRVAGGSVFTYLKEPGELQRRAAKVLDAYEAGWLRPGKGTAYPLSSAADAQRALESRSTAGKLYLTP